LLDVKAMVDPGEGNDGFHPHQYTTVFACEKCRRELIR